MFGGSAYEVHFIYRNRLHYTENNCQKVEVPGTITLKKWECQGTQASMVTTPMYSVAHPRVIYTVEIHPAIVNRKRREMSE
jgi:hypothetical protein